MRREQKIRIKTYRRAGKPETFAGRREDAICNAHPTTPLQRQYASRPNRHAVARAHHIPCCRRAARPIASRRRARRGHLDDRSLRMVVEIARADIASSGRFP
jgi:hypothetical protein